MGARTVVAVTDEMVEIVGKALWRYWSEVKGNAKKTYRAKTRRALEDALASLPAPPRPEASAPVGVVVTDEMVERGAVVLSEALGGDCLCNAMRKDVRAILSAALAGQQQGGA